jgi:hypothetical protein
MTGLSAIGRLTGGGFSNRRSGSPATTWPAASRPSAGPGFELKEFAIGLAAGIIFDATVIRALLVPAFMHLLGRANWWMPTWTRAALRIHDRERLRDQATQTV